MPSYTANTLQSSMLQCYNLSRTDESWLTYCTTALIYYGDTLCASYTPLFCSRYMLTCVRAVKLEVVLSNFTRSLHISLLWHDVGCRSSDDTFCSWHSNLLTSSDIVLTYTSVRGNCKMLYEMSYYTFYIYVCTHWRSAEYKCKLKRYSYYKFGTFVVYDDENSWHDNFLLTQAITSTLSYCKSNNN